ncbi:hypothetical protein H6G51_17110 [Limnothrix sp. FACHB-708]|nr:hypothetical protein [Limnothrix sp. FACHB-708]MBD2592464.1 hypothetical protein [Limnothrix sp. FACHB-406]
MKQVAPGPIAPLDRPAVCLRLRHLRGQGTIRHRIRDHWVTSQNHP